MGVCVSGLTALERVCVCVCVDLCVTALRRVFVFMYVLVSICAFLSAMRQDAEKVCCKASTTNYIRRRDRLRTVFLWALRETSGIILPFIVYFPLVFNE